MTLTLILGLLYSTVTGSSTETLHWSNPTTISLLPASNAGYQVTPAFSSRLTVTTLGQLVSQGNLEASDSNTVTISSSDFVGSYQTTIHISSETNTLSVHIYSAIYNALPCACMHSRVICIWSHQFVYYNYMYICGRKTGCLGTYYLKISRWCNLLLARRVMKKITYYTRRFV